MKKILSILAAVAAVSAMSVSASAADWSQTSYADNDPNTVKIISANENSITFTTSATSTDVCKARITLDRVLKNPADYSKITKLEWKVTYTGVSKGYNGLALSGGAYLTNANSAGYTIKADAMTADNQHGVWKNDVYSVMDSITVTTPVVQNGELVFTDWSFNNIGGAGVTVTVSDLKIYDASGAEIPQLIYGEYALVANPSAATTTVQTTTPVSATETPTQAAPVASTTDSAATQMPAETQPVPATTTQVSQPSATVMYEGEPTPDEIAFAGQSDTDNTVKSYDFIDDSTLVSVAPAEGPLSPETSAVTPDTPGTYEFAGNAQTVPNVRTGNLESTVAAALTALASAAVMVAASRKKSK